MADARAQILRGVLRALETFHFLQRPENADQNEKQHGGQNVFRPLVLRRAGREGIAHGRGSRSDQSFHKGTSASDDDACTATRQRNSSIQSGPSSGVTLAFSL